MSKVDSWWLVIVLAGRFPVDILQAAYNCYYMLPVWTFVAGLVIWAEIYWMEKGVEVSGLVNFRLVSRIRMGQLWNNRTNGFKLRLKKAIEWSFEKFELFTLYFLCLVVGGTFVACSLYSIAKPKFGRAAIVAGNFTRLSLVYFGVDYVLK